MTTNQADTSLAKDYNLAKFALRKLLKYKQEKQIQEWDLISSAATLFY